MFNIIFKLLSKIYNVKMYSNRRIARNLNFESCRIRVWTACNYITIKSCKLQFNFHLITMFAEILIIWSVY